MAHCAEGFIDRAIANNHNALIDSVIMHWNNQRAEDSEKHLCMDLGRLISFKLRYN
jgi:hypothetical protein